MTRIRLYLRSMVVTVICLTTISLFSGCELFIKEMTKEEMTQRAEGNYTYHIDYFDNAEDAVVDYGSDGWPESPNYESSGTLTVKATDEKTKLFITFDNGLSFTTSEIVGDALINPSGSFSFTIPQQNGIVGMVIGISPDDESWQGSFSLTSDFTGESNYELSFGLRYVDSDEELKYLRVTALSESVDLEEELGIEESTNGKG